MNGLGRGGENKEKEKIDVFTKETVGMTMIVFGAILMLIAVTQALIFGEVGVAITAFLFGVFGYMIYSYLLLLIVGGVALVAGKKLIPVRWVLRTLFFLCTVFMIVHFATTSSLVYNDYGEYLTACYEAGAVYGTGGGILFALLAYPVQFLLSTVGAYIFTSALVLLSIFLILRNTPLKDYFVKGEFATKREPKMKARPYPVELDFNDLPVEEKRHNDYPEDQPVVVEEPSERNYGKAILYGDRGASYRNNLIFDNNSQFNSEEYRASLERKRELNLGNIPTDSSFLRQTTNPTETNQSYSSRYAFEAENTRPQMPKHVTEAGGEVGTRSNFNYPNRPSYTAPETNSRPSFTAPETNSRPSYTAPETNSRPSYTAPETNSRPSYTAPETNSRPSYTAPETNSRSSYTAPEEPRRPSVDFSDRTIGRNTANDPYRNDVEPKGAVEPEIEPTQPSNATRESNFRSLFSRDFSKSEENKNSAPVRDFPLRGSETPSFRSEERTVEPTETQESKFTPPVAETRRDEPVRRMPEITTEPEHVDEFDQLFDDTADFTKDEGTATSNEETRINRGMQSVERAHTPISASPMPTAPVEFAPVKKRYVPQVYLHPSIELLDNREDGVSVNQEEIERNSRIIVETLRGFKVESEVVKVTCGACVTRYDIDVPANITLTTVTKYDEEIAMRLHATKGVNIYPNREHGAISIEVPNATPAMVRIRSVMAADAYVNSKPDSLMFVLGKDVEGRSVCGNIAKMKHLLVAGATGAGKSVCLNAMLISLITKYSPEELRLVLIDPKKVEFAVFEGLPHLMINEIISDAQKAVMALNWAIKEMERRYLLFQQMIQIGKPVRNIDEYNQNRRPDDEKMPKIVVVVDELADLMSVAKKEIEERIQRLTAKARAAGIHLVLATQRPSVDVITGVIKGNLPTRIAFRVVQENDSRTILDATGAQKLLGNGDMLYRTEGMFECARVQGAFISSEEVQAIVSDIKTHNEAYFDEDASNYINNSAQSEGASGEMGEEGSTDPQYVKALGIVVELGSASISLIQRKCSVGYNHAGKIIEWMELMGYISPFDGKAKARTVLLTKEEFQSKYGDLN